MTQAAEKRIVGAVITLSVIAIAYLTYTLTVLNPY